LPEEIQKLVEAEEKAANKGKDALPFEPSRPKKEPETKPEAKVEPKVTKTDKPVAKPPAPKPRASKPKENRGGKSTPSSGPGRSKKKT
jgi:hypothetical protein